MMLSTERSNFGGAAARALEAPEAVHMIIATVRRAASPE
jgi:hypothetical protein